MKIKSCRLIEKNQLIELIYDDELVRLAEELNEKGAVYELSHVESNLYVAKVKDGLNYEIEIQSPFAKKQKLSCECSFFKQNNICKHTIAGLLTIRELIKQKKEVKEITASEKSTKKLPSLNINQILDEIPHEDLTSFVKNYAKKDKKFSTLLKVSFARKIDLSDNSDKYKNILNTIVRPHTGEATRATSSDIKAIIHVLEDFADQINDCIALKQYREAFHIFTGAFSKLEYVRHYYSFHSDQLEKLGKTFHQIISYFLKEKLPPELRIELNQFLLDLSSRSYYHFHDLENNILALVADEYKGGEKAKLIHFISRHITDRNQKEKIILLALYIRISGKYTKDESEFLKPYAVHLIEIGDHLLAGNAEHLALKLLESIYQPKKYVKDVVNRLVFLYVRYKNVKKLLQTAKLAYINSGDIKYMEVLKRELPEDEYTDLLLNLEFELTAVKADPNLLIRIYRKEENWSGLLSYLSKLGNTELLRQHDVFLYRFERHGLVDLYIHLISNYLDEYVGDVAFHYLETLKNHFIHQKMDILTQKIPQLLREKYAHRPKLLEIFT